MAAGIAMVGASIGVACGVLGVPLVNGPVGASAPSGGVVAVLGRLVARGSTGNDVAVGTRVAELCSRTAPPGVGVGEVVLLSRPGKLVACARAAAVAGPAAGRVANMSRSSPTATC